MKITNVSIYGLNESIVGSGYPMLSKPMSEVEFESRVGSVNEEFANIIEYEGYVSQNRDIVRAIKLANTPMGSGHSNYLKGIIVQFDCNAPQYFWQQLQRYHFIDFVSSMSKMHCIGKITESLDAFDEATGIATIDMMCNLVKSYKDGDIDIDELLCNTPMGLEYTARLTTNYLQLKTIYKQRRNHRSQQWQVFCNWIETLPMAKELIYAEKSL